jgi:hypothetical protein
MTATARSPRERDCRGSPAAALAYRAEGPALKAQREMHPQKFLVDENSFLYGNENDASNSK